MARNMWLLISVLSVLGLGSVALAQPGQRPGFRRLEQHEPGERMAFARLADRHRGRAPKVEPVDSRSRGQVDKARADRAPKTTRQRRTRADMQRN